MDYTPKSLVFGADGRERLLSGLDKMAKAVGSTLGPRGRTVLIESQHHTHGITVTKDGVTVAKSTRSVGSGGEPSDPHDAQRC